MGLLNAPRAQISSTALFVTSRNCQSHAALSSLVSAPSFSSSCASCVSPSQVAEPGGSCPIKSQMLSYCFLLWLFKPVASSTGGVIMACRGLSLSGKFCGCLIANASGFTWHTESSLNLSTNFRVHVLVAASSFDAPLASSLTSISALPLTTVELLAIDTIQMARYS